jgi:transposase-like protein
MKIHREYMALAVSMYFDGFSIKDIRKTLDLQYNISCASSSIYEWIIRSSRKVANEMEKCTPKVGDTWLAGATVFNIGNKDAYLWNVIDKNTRYIISAGISFQPGTQYAAEIVKLAMHRARKTPQVILVEQHDEYQGYLDYLSGNVNPKQQSIEYDYALIKYLHAQLIHHAKLLHGIRNLDKAKTISDGLLCHHNFFKRCNDINGVFPSELTGVDKSISYSLLAYFKRVRRIIEASPQSRT